MRKVISLLQPWASLVVLGLKKIETRSWDTKHRGELLIHASKSKKFMHLMDDYEFEKHIHHNGKLKFPFGAIIGKVTVLDTCTTELISERFDEQLNIFKSEFLYPVTADQERAFGDYSPGRFGWLLADAVQFDEPYPAKGQLQIWNFDLEGAIDARHLEFLNSQPGRTNGK